MLSEKFDRMKDLIEIYQNEQIVSNYFQNEIQILKDKNDEKKQKIETKDKIIHKLIQDIQNEFGQPEQKYHNTKDESEAYINVYKYLIQEKYTAENGLTYSIKNKKATLLFDEIEESKEFIIPASINVNSVDYTVIKIFNSSLSKSKKVTFCNDSKLKTIGNNSFASSSIENISIPSEVTKIGHHSFWLCSKLQSIVFPKDSKIKKIGKHAFYYKIKYRFFYL